MILDWQHLCQNSERFFFCHFLFSLCLTPRQTIGKDHDKKKAAPERTWGFEEHHMICFQGIFFVSQRFFLWLYSDNDIGLILDSKFKLLSLLVSPNKETESVVKLVWEAFPLLPYRLGLISYFLNVETTASQSR